MTRPRPDPSGTTRPIGSTDIAGRRVPGAGTMPWQFGLVIAGVTGLILVGYVAVELGRNGRLGFPLDDPWIHLKFAKSLASGWGFAFNKGEPVAGSTAPLWTLLLAFGHLFVHNPELMVALTKLLAAGLLAVAGWFAGRLVSGVLRNRWAGLASSLALVTLCHFGWAMVSGMEVTLVVALVAGAAYYYTTTYRGRGAFLAWILLALAVYSRPEALAGAGFLVLDLLLRRVIFRTRVMIGRGVGVFLVLLLPYFVLNLTLAHSLFPQTYIAKVGRTSLFAALAGQDWPQVRLLLTRAPVMYFGGFVTHLWQANPVLVTMIPVGIFAWVQEYIRRRGTIGLLVPLVVVLYAPLVGAVAPFVAPAFQNGRYLGPPTGLAVALAGIGGYWLVTRVQRRAARLAIAGMLAVLVLFNVLTTGRATAINTARAESSINRQQVAIGKWLAENTEPGSVVACNDVGAIGYFGNRYLLDLLGLVTPEVSMYRQRRPIGQENLGALDFVRQRQPDYLVIFPEWFPNLGKAEFLTPVYVSDLPDNTASAFFFQPRLRTVAGLLVLGLDVAPIPAKMVVYRCVWRD